MTGALWWGLWVCVGAMLAYLYAAAYLTYTVRMKGGDSSTLFTATAVATCVAGVWAVGYSLAGPLWALLTLPPATAGVLLGLKMYAYMREQAALVRVLRREAGK